MIVVGTDIERDLTPADPSPGAEVSARGLDSDGGKSWWEVPDGAVIEPGTVIEWPGPGCETHRVLVVRVTAVETDSGAVHADMAALDRVHAISQEGTIDIGAAGAMDEE